MENFNFGLAGAGLTIILNALPFFSFLNFFKKTITFEAICASRIFMNYANCLIWYFYGSMKVNTAIRISNLIGAIISVLLIIMYLIFEFKNYLLDTILNILIIFIGTIASNEWFSHIVFDEKLVGGICLFITIISFLVQIPNIFNGIKEKNYLLIPVNYSIIGFPMYFCWVVFSLIVWDYYILVANSIGVVYSITLVLIYSYYRKEYPIINEETEASTIGIDIETKKEKHIEII
jgi:hypothetical protein